jgi:hypothetical protein
MYTALFLVTGQPHSLPDLLPLLDLLCKFTFLACAAGWERGLKDKSTQPAIIHLKGQEEGSPIFFSLPDTSFSYPDFTKDFLLGVLQLLQIIMQLLFKLILCSPLDYCSLDVTWP